MTDISALYDEYLVSERDYGVALLLRLACRGVDHAVEHGDAADHETLLADLMAALDLVGISRDEVRQMIDLDTRLLEAGA